MDASQVRVRVPPSRFHRLKTTIALCDRNIQKLDKEISNLLAELEYLHVNLFSQRSQKRTKSQWEKKRQKRAKLDEKRKAARLEIQGYISQDMSSQKK